jgi:hypothetical protein
MSDDVFLSRRSIDDQLASTTIAHPSKKIGFDATGGFNLGWGVSPSQHATRFHSSVDATITRLAVLKAPVADAGVRITMGIYSDNGSKTDPQTLIEQTVEYVSLGAIDGRLIALDLLNPVNIVKDTVYWLVCFSENGFAAEGTYNAPASGGQRYWNQAYSSTLPGTWGPSTANSGGHICISGW